MLGWTNGTKLPRQNDAFKNVVLVEYGIYAAKMTHEYK